MTQRRVALPETVRTGTRTVARSAFRMISFELSDEQREIRDWVHDFAEREIRPVAHEYDEKEEFPWEVVKKAADVGLYGTDFLAQIHGDATGVLPALVAEELCWGCAGIGLAIQGSQLPVAAIVG